MFLKQEKPEIDDFEEKNFDSKGKRLNIIRKYYLTDTLAKMSQNIFCIFFRYIFFFLF